MLKTTRSSILWAGACVAILVAAPQSARAQDDCSGGQEMEMVAAAAALMPNSPTEAPLDASRRWARGHEADAWYRAARSADLEIRDRDAVAAYGAVLQIDPQNLEALHRLAYLQAASDDSTVRNQVAAMANSQRALDILLGMMVGRRSLPQETVRKLGTLRVEILNALAAVAASGGNFKKATDLVETAINKARSIAETDPQNNSTHLAILRLQNNLAALQANQPIRGARQIQ
jgi:tetratricopeptide (TPR) repeat protein